MMEVIDDIWLQSLRVCNVNRRKSYYLEMMLRHEISQGSQVVIELK